MIAPLLAYAIFYQIITVKIKHFGVSMKLGRLKSLGITEAWQVPLYCPVDYRDYSQYFDTFDKRFLIDGGFGIFRGRIAQSPKVEWKNKKPRTQFVLTDGTDTIAFSIFGDTRELVDICEQGTPMAVSGFVSRIGNGVYLNKAEIIPIELMGRIVPVYKGIAGKVKAQSVYSLISNVLDDCISSAADKLRSVLIEHIPARKIREFVQCPSMTLEQILHQLHFPDSMDRAFESLEVMSKIAHLVAADELIKRSKGDEVKQVPPLVGADPISLTANIPFDMTDEQMEQAMIAIDDIRRGNLLNSLLVGDVGTGKTIVYGLIAAYVASAGGRVGIMLPNQNLARQIHEELSQYFGGLGVGLVTGGGKTELADERIIVGTTALLFRDLGDLSLVVCDEQQKMATSQREKLRSANTHLLEVSATPIPRTMAFALYGAVKLLQLKKCHVDKTIITSLYEKQDKRKLFSGIKETLARGQKVLVVCARCEAEESPDDDEENRFPVLSAEQLHESFSRQFPNRVTISHSRLSDEENAKAISDIKEGVVDILVSTTVVEVGMTIPNLERIVIFNAEKFGIQQLHQLRGRVARAGGAGHADLYLPNPVKNPDTLARLQVMVNCSDGFEIAVHDLKIRGTGDISNLGENQHGTYRTVIRNIKGDLDDIEATIERVQALNDECLIDRAS